MSKRRIIKKHVDYAFWRENTWGESDAYEEIDAPAVTNWENAVKAKLERCTHIILLVSKNALNWAQTKPDTHDPPKFAELLLTLFATTRRAEAQIGDLNERFADECKKLGRDRACGSIGRARCARCGRC
jgi:hypothetical protein